MGKRIVNEGGEGQQGALNDNKTHAETVATKKFKQSKKTKKQELTESLKKPELKCIFEVIRAEKKMVFKSKHELYMFLIENYHIWDLGNIESFLQLLVKNKKISIYQKRNSYFAIYFGIQHVRPTSIRLNPPLNVKTEPNPSRHNCNRHNP